jgi:DNA-binding SARP family transcriptional activator
MSALRIRLFGKFSATSDGRELEKLDACKSQELLCYLLVHRARPHPRESLAAMLWGDATTEKSKKYLRQSLWHLQSVLDARRQASPRVSLLRGRATVLSLVRAQSGRE